MEGNKSVIAIVGILAVLGIGFFVMSNNSADETASQNADSVTQQESLPENTVEDAMEAQDAMEAKDSMEKTDQTIVDVAVGAGNFNTLVTAVQAAGLVEALSAEGPFTVFAPTDEAFAKVPQETLDALLADPAALANVLTYHVVEGKVMAADVVNLTTATTLQGQDVTIEVLADDTVKINDATVITTDIEASNGVIHVIDTVILPQ